MTFIHFYSNCSFIFDTYSINLCLGYQLFIICSLIPLYFFVNLHRYSSIYLPNVWTLPSESFLPFCLVQEYSYLCGQGRDVTLTIKVFTFYCCFENPFDRKCRWKELGGALCPKNDFFDRSQCIHPQPRGKKI